MRYFKLVGAEGYTYYDSDNRRVFVPKGQFLTCTYEGHAEKFEKDDRFVECDSTGKIGVGLSQHPAERITSRAVYKRDEKGNLVRQ